MKKKAVTLDVLVSLLWAASPAALAQPDLSPADRPQRASNRDHPGAFRGPAPMQGASLERWPSPRRAHRQSGSDVAMGPITWMPFRRTTDALRSYTLEWQGGWSLERR
jgi:hypothetical protein